MLGVPMVALPEMLQRRVQQHPDRIALREQDSELSYPQMWQAIQALAEQLQHLGIKRAGLCGDNAIAWVLADLACLMAGVVCVPGPMFFSNRLIAHLTGSAGLDCLLLSGQTEQAEPIGQGAWLRQLP